MSAASWIKPVRHVIGAAALALALGGFAGSAWAQAAADEDDIDNHLLNADKRMLNAILAPLGLGSDPGPDIKYRERSPLVIPTGRDLPPPGAKTAKAPNWPTEPEIKAKRKAREENTVGKKFDPARPIAGTPEMNRVDTEGKWDESGKKVQRDEGFLEMIVNGRLFKGGSFYQQAEVGTFEGEPPRTSLIAPPAGYLTPSPAAPYGVTPRAMVIPKKDPKP